VAQLCILVLKQSTYIVQRSTNNTYKTNKTLNNKISFNFLNITIKKKILRKLYPLLYMSIQAIDLNEEAKEETPALEPIEEEAKEPETTIDTANEVIEEATEPPKEEQPKPKPKAKPKASDIVPCPDCNKTMTYKNLRYSHK